jgi:hypothetical protein
MVVQPDKYQHALVSFGLVWLFWIWNLATQPYGFSTCSIPCRRSMVLVLILGAAKEAMDAVSTVIAWPWCRSTCHPDGLDMVADVLGVVAAGVSLWIVQAAALHYECCCRQIVRRISRRTDAEGSRSSSRNNRAEPPTQDHDRSFLGQPHTEK